LPAVDVASDTSDRAFRHICAGRLCRGSPAPRVQRLAGQRELLIQEQHRLSGRVRDGSAQRLPRPVGGAQLMSGLARRIAVVIMFVISPEARPSLSASS
jgi:hypothetical protein